ncbi:MAG UNVERIFIED_CONTAM: hypothetical protein LVR18_40210 [Planctomycetaceae bacterium]
MSTASPSRKKMPAIDASEQACERWEATLTADACGTCGGLLPPRFRFAPGVTA